MKKGKKKTSPGKKSKRLFPPQKEKRKHKEKKKKGEKSPARHRNG